MRQFSDEPAQSRLEIHIVRMEKRWSGLLLSFESVDKQIRERLTELV